MKIVLTYHAKQRMAQKAITLNQIKRAIRQGAKIRQTDGFLASYCYLKVAYKKVGKGLYKIKTVFIE